MIGKVTRGKDIAGLLRYLFGKGHANEHTDPHVIGAWDPQLVGVMTVQNGRIARLMEQPVAGLIERPDRPVWHCSLRTAPGDRPLTDIEWNDVVATVLARTGLAVVGDDQGCRWVAVKHADDHVHLAVTLARQDGGKVSTSNDFYRVADAAHEVEARYGLTVTPASDRTASNKTTRAERV